MTGTRRDLFALSRVLKERRAIGYARYSSTMQKDGWTIAAQLAAVREHCEAAGVPLVAETRDEARSGTPAALGWKRRWPRSSAARPTCSSWPRSIA